MIVEKFQLVLNYKNPNYTEDENYIRYFVMLENKYLNQLLKARGYTSKSEIYENLGFKYKGLDTIYTFMEPYGVFTTSCSGINVFFKKGYKVEYGNVYLINVEILKD